MKLYIRNKTTWYVKFDDDSGKTVRLSTDIDVGTNAKKSREEAEQAALKKMQEHLHQAVAKVDRPKRSATGTPLRPNLALALERTWNRVWAKSRSAIVLRHVIPVIQAEIGHWILAEIDHDRIENYLNGLLRDPVTNPKGLSPATVNRRRSYIRKALGDAIGSGLLDKLPAFPQRQKERNRKIRFLLNDEETRALEWLSRQIQDDHVDRRPEWQYLHDLCVFLLDTGFRFSEVFKFSVPRDVHPDIDGKFADLAPDTTKNDEGRRIPLTVRAQEAATRLLASPFHIRTEDENVVSKHWDWCSYRIDRCWRAVGINKEDTAAKQKVTIHILRHTCASRLVQRGVPIFIVKEWMGHKSIATTMRYAHLAPNSLSGALAALEGKPIAVGQQLSAQCALPNDSVNSDIGHSRISK